MGYFPFFMEIEDKKGVVLGGGQVAARKVEKLLPFGPRLICIAPVICARIESLAQGADSLRSYTGKLAGRIWKGHALLLRQQTGKT